MIFDLVGVAPVWLIKIVEGISYKPGWSLVITSRNDSLDPSGGPYLYTINARCVVNDVVTKNSMTLLGPGITVYRDRMEEKMIVHMIFSILRALEQHEMEEQFGYNGFRVYDPHRNPQDQNKLWELAARNPELEPGAQRLTYDLRRAKDFTYE